MPKFEVIFDWVSYCRHEIDAENEADAIEKARNVECKQRLGGNLQELEVEAHEINV